MLKIKGEKEHKVFDKTLIPYNTCQTTEHDSSWASFSLKSFHWFYEERIIKNPDIPLQLDNMKSHLHRLILVDRLDCFLIQSRVN